VTGLSQYANIPFLPYLNANISRKKGLIVMFFCTIITFILQLVVDPQGCVNCVKGINLVLLLIFFFLSRFFISLFTSFNFNVINESFPAQVRSICYCGAVGIARISTVLIPFIPKLKQTTHIPYNMMFAITTLIGLIICFFIRETINIPPP